VLVAGTDRTIRRVNSQLEALFGYEPGTLVGRSVDDLLPTPTRPVPVGPGATFTGVRKIGGEFPADVAFSQFQTSSGRVTIATVRDMTEWQEARHELARRAEQLAQANEGLERERAERLRTDAELRVAQKLEAVGQLAAGIAHEINTPMQYIGDSLYFLQEAFEDQRRFIEVANDIARQLTARPATAPMATALNDVAEQIELDYLLESTPRAFARVADGVARVTKIVQAMKEFAHPDSEEKTPNDVNRAIENALVLCRNEYKYVADVETTLGDLPLVPCHLGELNQVLLNLIVNAAHAISDVVAGSERRGLIRISTQTDGSTVTIAIADSGTGIPAGIRDRIFDPFFTTKPVGQGSGQGLALARAIVANKHGGQLTFETEEGRGTTFFVRLPLDADTASQTEAHAGALSGQAGGHA
jgi:PAS domain S-box-containing protein